MKLRPFLCFLALAFCCAERLAATDIVLLSGKKYLDVHDVQIRGNFLSFTTESDIVKVPLSDVPKNLKDRYQPKALPTATPAALEANRLAPGSTIPAATNSKPTPIPTNPHDLVVATGNKYLGQMAADLQLSKTSAATTYTAANAFSIAQTGAASKDALANGRAVAFFILEDNLLNTPCLASQASATGALAHFFQTFGRNVTPVFVFPKRDLAGLPRVLTIALGKPAAVAAPRVIFTNSDISEVLYDLTLSTEKMTFAQRNEIIYPAAGMIKRWYVKIANSVH